MLVMSKMEMVVTSESKGIYHIERVMENVRRQVMIPMCWLTDCIIGDL